MVYAPDCAVEDALIVYGTLAPGAPVLVAGEHDGSDTIELPDDTVQV
jgi:hypothetical protein